MKKERKQFDNWKFLTYFSAAFVIAAIKIAYNCMPEILRAVGLIFAVMALAEYRWGTD